MKQMSLIRRRSLLAAPLLLGASSMLAQMPRPLLIAVPPFLSPSAALAAFRPLRQHLESQLKQPVELYTARDFRELVEQTRRGEHDVTLLPAHLAGLALSDWGFQALAATVEATPVLILLRQGSAIKTAAELRGKRMGMLGTLSLTAAVATLWLRQQQWLHLLRLQGQLGLLLPLWRLLRLWPHLPRQPRLLLRLPLT